MKNTISSAYQRGQLHTYRANLKMYDKPFLTFPVARVFPVLLIWQVPFQTDIPCSASKPDSFAKSMLCFLKAIS